jgi:hypothetical protein
MANFYRLILTVAWEETRRFLWEHLYSEGLLVVAAAVVGYLTGERPNQIGSAFLHAVAGIGLVVGITFLYYFVYTPSRLYFTQQTEIQKLEKLLKPTLKIEFEQGGPSYCHESEWFSELSDLFDKKGASKGIGYWRLIRLAVTNLSNAISIEHVEVKLTNIEPCPNELAGHLPLSLHFMHDNHQPYQQWKDLNPGLREYIDVVSWRWNRGEGVPRFRVEHIVHGVDGWFSIGNYKITIQASGRNVSPEIAHFHIGLRNEDPTGNKLWMWRT